VSSRMPCLTVVCAMACTMCFPATAASQSTSEAAGTPQGGSIQKIVSSESDQVKRQFPSAKLFQVSILEVVPTKLESGQIDSSAIASSYYIGSPNEFVQASKEPSDRPEVSNTVVVKKSSASEDCMKGYPGKGVNSCAEGLGGPKKDPGKLNPEIVSNLAKVVPKLSNLGIDINEPVAMNITTAGRALEGFEESRSANQDLLEHLRAMPADQPVLSVSEVSGPNRGSSVWFTADSGEMLGRSRVTRSHAPPGLNR
jgi:hypothetical protein